MKIKIGIVGYGNLGRACEKLLQDNKLFKLVAIFSRRKNISSPFKTKIEDYCNAKNYINKIDVMLMCGGSKNDLMIQSPEMLKYFNIIDTFDTHKKAKKHRKNLKKVSFLSRKTAIYSCGWDPGFLSIIRAYSSALFNGVDVYTLWGKGVSQGHSDALRKIDGIEDAIEFTIPQKGILKRLLNNEKIASQNMHKRVCFVCLKDGTNLNKIKKEILNMPYYFKGQDVEINFCSQLDVLKKKMQMFHEGKVVAIQKDKMASAVFCVKMKNNPIFTANILLSFAKIIKNLSTGVYSPLEISPIQLDKNLLKIL